MCEETGSQHAGLSEGWGVVKGWREGGAEVVSEADGASHPSAQPELPTAVSGLCCRVRGGPTDDSFYLEAEMKGGTTILKVDNV